MPITQLKQIKRRRSLNLELMDWIIEHVDAEPGRLDMGEWAEKVPLKDAKREGFPPCGTTCCYAGWATFKGARPIFTNAFEIEKFDGRTHYCLTDKGSDNIQAAARRLLGFTYQEASDIFYGSDNESLKRDLNALLVKRGMKPRYGVESDDADYVETDHVEAKLNY